MKMAAVMRGEGHGGRSHLFSPEVESGADSNNNGAMNQSHN